MWLGHWVGLSFLVALGACSSSVRTPPPVEDLPPFADEYRIGVGDSLAIDVYRHEDLSVNVTVRPDGKITVPVAGDVLVGGNTPEAVSDIIETSLSEFVRDPIVTTTVASMGSAEYSSRVRVTGAVNNPSSLPFRSGMTVLDVILEVGGPNEFANPNRTLLYRGGGEPRRIRLDRLLKGGDMSTNFYLRPGDIISVPERVL